jgi:MFS family permease
VSEHSSRGVLWRHAGFMRLWSAQAISTFGARIARTAIPMTAVMTIQARPSALGLLAALGVVPAVFVGLFAGGFIDRSSRRLIMIAADVIRAVVLIAIPISAVLHLLSMAELIVAAMVAGGASALFDIADHAYLPSLIGKADLVDGNSKLAVTESLSEIGGPSIAGFLVQLLTAPIAIGATAFSYLASAALLGTIRQQEPEKPSGKKRVPWYHDIRSGLDAILANEYVKPLFIMAVISPIFEGSFSALYTIYALKVLKLSPDLVGVIVGVGGAASLAGATLSQFFCRQIGFGRAIVFGYMSAAASAFFVPLAGGSIWFSASMLILAQLFGDSLALVAMIPAGSLRQSVLPGSILGRTAALFRAGNGGALVLGSLLGGLLGDAIGIRQTLSLAVCGMVLTTTIALFSPLIRLKEIPAAAE